MTKSKKNLLVSLLVLILTVAIAGGSTYAWFTVNTKVTIPEMDINVTTGSQGLYISVLEAGPYKTSLDMADLKAAGYEDNVKLANVTSPDGKVMSTLAGTGATAPTKGDDATAGDYVEFKVFFRATGASAPIVDLGTLNITDKTGTKPLTMNNDFKAIAAGDYGQTAAYALGAAINARASSAARMSFESVPKDLNNSTIRVWDPCKGDAKTFCGVTPFDNSTKNFALDYYNFTKDMEDGKLDGGEPAKLFGNIAPTELQDVFNKDVLKLSKNDETGFFEGSLTVRIWIEGFDGDCFNSILNDAFLANMNFVVRDII